MPFLSSVPEHLFPLRAEIRPLQPKGERGEEESIAIPVSLPVSAHAATACSPRPFRADLLAEKVPAQRRQRRQRCSQLPGPCPRHCAAAAAPRLPSALTYPALCAIAWLPPTPLFFSSCTAVQKNLQIHVLPAELFSFLNTVWAGVDACEKETEEQADAVERQCCKPGGAKENFFCCFWISSPRVSLCFSARAALKYLTVHFSVVIQRSLLPTAHIFSTQLVSTQSAMKL